jgi:hypothetical protein
VTTTTDTILPIDFTVNLTSCIDARATVYASTLKRDQKAVLGAILHHMFYGKDDSFPSEPLMSDETGICLRTVKKAVAALKKRGWLQITSKGKGYGNHYVITPVAADVRPDVLVKARARQSSIDAKNNLADHRESKGLPREAPAMTDAASAILAALIELPALALIANNSNALELSTTFNKDTGEIIEVDAAIRALTKLHGRVLREPKAPGGAQLMRQAVHAVRCEYEVPVPAPVKVAKVAPVKVERPPVPTAEQIAESERAATLTRSLANDVTKDGAAAALDAVRAVSAGSTPVRTPVQPVPGSFIDMLGPSMVTTAPVVPMFDEQDSIAAYRELAAFDGPEPPTMAETRPLSRRMHKGEISDLVYEQDHDYAVKCWEERNSPFEGAPATVEHTDFDLTNAYAKGIMAESGDGYYMFPKAVNGIRAMIADYATYSDGTPVTQQDLLAWVHDTAQAFRAAIDPNDACYYKSYQPDGCVKWLNKRRPTSKKRSATG